MEGILSIVCTPIGNLKDIGQRALDVLSNAQFILAEDTKHCLKLFRALEIDLAGKKILSCHQHNEESRAEMVVDWISTGQRVALVSDAGAPAVSDPGGRLVDAIVKAKLPIEVIPGPSAVIAALMGAGLISHRFAFFGFLPKKGVLRKRLIGEAQALGLAVVIYEGPFRVEKTLNQLHEICGAKRVVVARELTKKFEMFHRGILGLELTPPFVKRGECVIIVEGDAKDPVRPKKPKFLPDAGLISPSVDSWVPAGAGMANQFDEDSK